jgi:hypothetical protein
MFANKMQNKKRMKAIGGDGVMQLVILPSLCLPSLLEVEALTLCAGGQT